MCKILKNLVVLTAILFIAASLPATAQTTNTWAFDADGVWHNAANWTPGSIPNLTNSSAILWGGITANRTIRYDSNVKLGSLSISNSANYTLSGFGTLTFDNFGSGVGATLDVFGSGAPEITSLMNVLENL
ncbi:MAG: hypothetical protein JWM04_657, partial [Verrucomicrobiales bacterium]|nr:hypothetical protein [Verrucomicrobiales bacterium]